MLPAPALPHQMQRRCLFGRGPLVTLPKRPADWKRVQPTSLRHAIELCKNHALTVHNRSVERIAELMGLPDHWALYKWLQNGRMPACLIRPYEQACGAHYITRWVAASAGLLTVDMPTGRTATASDMVALNTGFAQALQLLTNLYQGGQNGGPKADAAATLEALRSHLEQVAYHHHNVAQHATPQLEF